MLGNSSQSAVPDDLARADREINPPKITAPEAPPLTPAYVKHMRSASPQVAPIIQSTLLERRVRPGS